MISTAGGRKFIIALLYVLLSAVMVVFKLVPGTSWIEMAGYVVLAYFGGNAAEWFARKPGKIEVPK